jgi:hypothetical protein
MNKNIYRGKRKDTNEWIKGDLVHVISGNTAVVSGNMTDVYIVCNGIYYDVFPETVGQCTEMLDIDTNEVFEDDIVELTDDVKKTFDVSDGVVKYGRGGFYIHEFGLLNSLNALATYDCILRGRVIGNIHDNPELLKK